jgi:hypothetical protein
MSTIGGSPARCESGDQRSDEGCECDGCAAAPQRHCGVSATEEWRRRCGGGVSEGLGLGAPRGWSFYTVASIGARVCLGGQWARMSPLVGRLGRAHAGLLPTGYTSRPSGYLFRVVPCLAQRAWGEAQAWPRAGFVPARPNRLRDGPCSSRVKKNRASCWPTKPGPHGQV